MGPKENDSINIYVDGVKYEPGTTTFPEVEPVEKPVEYVKKPTEYEFEIPLNITLNELEEAINNMAPVDALTEMLRNIDKQLRIMCEVRREHPKWWYYHLNAKKYRTRKKYGNMIKKAYEAKDKKEGDTYECRG